MKSTQCTSVSILLPLDLGFKVWGEPAVVCVLLYSPWDQKRLVAKSYSAMSSQRLSAILRDRYYYYIHCKDEN